MRKEDLGKVRTTPINQLKWGNFGHVYKGSVTLQEKQIEYLVYYSEVATKVLIPESRAELKENIWTEKGIKFIRLGK